MMRLILRSTDVNCDAYDIVKTNWFVLNLLIWPYWENIYYLNYNFKNNIKYSLYLGNNKISDDSIMEALTK